VADAQTCVTCGKQAPETETNYTLISAQFGWRLTRYKRPDGTLVLEWRCPTCWREFKRSRGVTGPGASAGGGSSTDSRNPGRPSSAPPPSDVPPPPPTPGRPGRAPR
jgi:DNA-directed RNA polymerase subunit RPC12/RpoP